MQNYLLDPIGDDNVGEKQNNDFLQKVIVKLLNLWPWLLVSVITCVALAFFYYKTVTPIYTAYAAVLVQDDKKGTDFGQSNILQDFGLLVDKSSVDNEVEIFKSRTLMAQVVKDLQLNVRYFINGKIGKKELYYQRPVSLRLLEVSYLTPAAGEYTLLLNKEKTGFKLTNTSGDEVFTGRIGDTLNTKSGTVIVQAEEAMRHWNAETPLSINISNLEFTLRQYMGSLSVIVPNKLVSVIDLSLNEVLPEKAELILNKLISVYLQASVDDKSRTADTTVKFIDERLKLVFKELSGIEGDIEDFKKSNKIADVSEQTKLLLDNTSEYAKQQTELEVQLSVVNALEAFLKDNVNNERIVPSSLVMQDPSFIELIQQYNQMQLEREKILVSKTEAHPSVLLIEEQLRSLRIKLLSSIGSVKSGIQISINELKKKTGTFESQISKVPAKERIFLDYSRQQSIKQELYLFLLKKREETAISKSSTIANARIIDSAKSNNIPISPKRNKILLIGLLFGLAVPIAISYIKDFLNNKINSLEDIAAFTNVPVLAEIGHNPEESVVAINLSARTVIAEQFRGLRTSLQYVLPTEEKKIILTTSSMSGEGKSFLSINLCTSLALAGKKVVLLELDLRRPKVSDNLNLLKRGFTNFIVSGDTNWQQWIQESGVHENFFVLSSGPLPPNPSELLMLPKVETLFNSLKEHYDYIVIDSAPIGLVTDAQIIAKLADITLYVVRNAYTYKQQLKGVEKLYKKNNLPKMNIVINDIKLKKVAYGYGYGYGYSVYGYDSNS